MGNYYNKPKCNKCNNSIQNGDKLATQNLQGNLQFKEEMGTRRCTIKLVTLKKSLESRV
jgi:hypothetical protein